LNVTHAPADPNISTKYETKIVVNPIGFGLLDDIQNKTNSKSNSSAPETDLQARLNMCGMHE